MTQKQFFSASFSLKRFFSFLAILIAFITLLFYLQIPQPLRPPFCNHQHNNVSTQLELELHRTRSMLRESVTFLPLRDPRLTAAPAVENTWFMSSVNGTIDDDGGGGGGGSSGIEYLHFPSKESAGRILCLLARDDSDGTKNSYALAWPEALPRGAALLSGATFVSDTYFDYINLWHGLTTVVPFAWWHGSRGCAAPAPARWVLFHWGELRKEMSPWLRALVEATIGKMEVETFEKYDGGRPVCFEEAVVFRHNLKGMSRREKEEVFDMMRCKARAHCGVGNGGGGGGAEDVRMTLLVRSGARSFKNESAVVSIFDKECRKVGRCRFSVGRPENMTFCDQVKLLSETDVLVSAHGAQVTNMIFMNKNSSIMEFYPRGWKELAGTGQYVFRWMADWVGLRHQGSWWEPNSDELCPSQKNKIECFLSYKNHPIGHDEPYFRQWAAKVLREAKEYKMRSASTARRRRGSTFCQCG